MSFKTLLTSFIIISSSLSYASIHNDFFNVIGTSEGKLYVECSLSTEGERVAKKHWWRKIPSHGNFLLVSGDETIQKEIMVDERPGFFKGKWAQIPNGHHKIGFVDSYGDTFEIILVSGVSLKRANLCILNAEELKEISEYRYGL